MKRFKPFPMFSAAALAAGTASLLAAAALPTQNAGADGEAQLSIARIYWEYNSTANDLGVHVLLDGEDWNKLKIRNPSNKVIFDVRGRGPYKQLGMTELFFEGAEPSLNEFPLDELLALFPEGEYEFEGQTVESEEIEGEALFSHAIPAGPEVFSSVGQNDFLQISWLPVTQPPPGFPPLPIEISGYQLIVEGYLVTVPGSVLSLTVSPEFVAALAPGRHQYEVLAIHANGNQSITEGYFSK